MPGSRVRVRRKSKPKLPRTQKGPFCRKPFCVSGTSIPPSNETLFCECDGKGRVLSWEEEKLPNLCPARCAGKSAAESPLCHVEQLPYLLFIFQLFSS